MKTVDQSTSERIDTLSRAALGASIPKGATVEIGASIGFDAGRRAFSPTRYYVILRLPGARDYAPRTDLGVVVWCVVTAAVCDGKSRARAPEREVGVFEVGCPACGAYPGAECVHNTASRACYARIRIASDATTAARFRTIR